MKLATLKRTINPMADGTSRIIREVELYARFHWTWWSIGLDIRPGRADFTTPTAVLRLPFFQLRLYRRVYFDRLVGTKAIV